MDDSDQSEQAYDDSSTYEEPVVDGWGDTYGDAPAQEEEQSVWEDVTEWVEDVTDDIWTPAEETPAEKESPFDGISDIVDGLLRPQREQAERRDQLEGNHLSAFRGRLNSAIQATELLGPESSSEEVQYASGLITTAANTAYAAADELGRESDAGRKYEYYHGMLAWAASQLEAVAWSNSESSRQYDIPGILSTLRDVGSDSESLY